MALERTIDGDKFESLSEDLKSEYIAGDDGQYTLNVSGLEDTGALKRALDRERAERSEAKTKLAELQEKLDSFSQDDAKKKGDIETLQKQWERKQTKAEKEWQEKLTKANAYIKSSLVDAKATELAAKISTSPAVIMPHIKARLAANLDGDTPETVILDKNGEPSSLTLQDLAEEFIANKDFSAIIIGSKASGSSAADKTKPGGGAFSGESEDLTKMSKEQFTERIRQKVERNKR